MFFIFTILHKLDVGLEFSRLPNSILIPFFYFINQQHKLLLTSFSKFLKSVVDIDVWTYEDALVEVVISFVSSLRTLLLTMGEAALRLGSADSFSIALQSIEKKKFHF